MRGARFGSWSLLLWLVACQGAPAPMEPAGPAAGVDAPLGVVRFDAEPPAGVATYGRPTWRAGDRFVLRRGGGPQGAFTVLSADADGYVLDTGGAVRLHRDLDLGMRGEFTAAGEPRRAMVPAEARYHWPLWVGKRWSCAFDDQAPNGASVPLLAEYHVEGMDTVAVPAGSFQALRILVRLQRRGGDGRFLERVQMHWYAPAEGLEVRQLLGDSLVELVEVQRAK